MKALSLIQPYATLIQLGYKQFETRSWSTKHRGHLAIHASVGKPYWARHVCENNSYIREALAKHGLTFDSLPRGAILGTCNVDDCFNIIGKDSIVGLTTKAGEVVVAKGDLSQMEIAAGDYCEGRFAWKLSDVVTIMPPIPCRGSLSLWQVPDEVVDQFPASA
ncbi:ASCH domain-containing protein [Hymenobacter gelipurpurascens]|uniref:ASCH domain-containing protein n=1 Tax=Hymenobacter gelipurpurascens TaxID=89968 RepID=A0A212T979_9BACT|nr:ASCH domain-containing protein [Hymenobacter gelipurpurascens]SNC62354.1 ASCH domain-containing protein [Hymenobacter gelipurpurascens]